MANRVRFLSLTLAGFGRYDRPTRFNLEGRSCSFTAPNELGKSTFQAGLFATLFGPPSVRAKVAAFQSRYRSWHGPPAFWGQLDFTVNDQPWRVRHDFDALEVNVWRTPNDGPPELRYHAKLKTSRSTTEPDPYARLLEDWLGISDQSLYAAMFTISQESTLSASWQIDPRIASFVYGPAVERLNSNLHELFERFREITRNTREFQMSVGSQGERNGRSDGRLDEVVARIEQLESCLQAAQDRSQRVAELRSRLAEVEIQCEQLRSQVAETTNSLANWQTWMELESRLRPAVESYDRLRQLNERCQQVTRPLAELRARLGGDLRIFDDAPDDLAERLSNLPLWEQLVAEATQRHYDAVGQAEQLRSELSSLQASLNAEFQNHRTRPQLADHVEELRGVRAELACVEGQLRELTEEASKVDGARADLQHQLDAIAEWRRLGADAEDRLASARKLVEQFCRDHAEYHVNLAATREATHWLAEQHERISRHADGIEELQRDRGHQRSLIAEHIQELRRQLDSAQRARSRIENQRRDLQRRYVDFVGAPAELPQLWDRLHSLDALVSEASGRVQATRDAMNQTDRRIYWRRGITGLGSVVLTICLLLGSGWVGWSAAAIAAALCGSLRWIFRVDSAQIAANRRHGQQAEADQLRLARQRDDLVAEIGPQFVAPLEREAEWRRLWPTYRRELARLDAETQTLPTDQNVAALEQSAVEKEKLLERFDDETCELIAELEVLLERARAEHDRREQELLRLRDQLAEHSARYFGTVDDWPARPTSDLDQGWDPVLQVAAAASPTISTAAELADWCCGLTEYDWRRFSETCEEVRRLVQLFTPDPVVVAAREAAIDEATALEHTLHERARRLADAVAPFNADTDPAWLRERWSACQLIEDRRSELERQSQVLPSVESLAAELNHAEAQRQAAIAELAPFLAPYDQNPKLAANALDERRDLLQQVREFERAGAELLVESGFTSLEQLAHEAGKAEGLVNSIRTESQEMIARTTELWEAVDGPADLPARRSSDLASRLTELQSSLENSARERAELAATIRQMEVDPASDIAAIQTELQLLRVQQAELEKRRDQIAVEFQEANRLMQDLKRVERTALEGRITAYFADFSRTARRRIQLDEELHISVRNEDGTCHSADHLSCGARDQLYLAVYLATTAGFDLPFILDDPFVNCDAERLAAIRTCWDRLIPDHQLILLSHDPQMAAWAPALQMREAA